MRRGLRLLLLAAIAGLALSTCYAAAAGGIAPARPALRTEPIDETDLVSLPGNTAPGAATAQDLGRVAATTRLEHMHLLMQRTPQAAREVAAFVDAQHTRGTPAFHHWLTPSEFGRRFGPAAADLDRVNAWLRQHGFTINHVYASRMVIDFSGTAGQVAETFHAPIHRLAIAGTVHLGNLDDPRIPAALRRIVAGVVSLHDIRAHSQARPRAAYTNAADGATLVTPADLATIYGFTAPFSAGLIGLGQTVAVVGDSDLYDNTNWLAFRNTFRLDQFAIGTLQTVHPAPAGGAACADPGITSDDAEAAIDSEWATAAAPGASIVLATCAGSNATDGVYVAIQNLVNAAVLPQIISVSYGVCETENGATRNAALAALYQQAASEGISVFVAAGDSGAAECTEAMQPAALLGTGVNGWASTAYDVAVGATDFMDTFKGNVWTYWKKQNAGAPWGTAKSYIPEMTWNDSCASPQVVIGSGYAAAYGAATATRFCNLAAGAAYIRLGIGGGGPSRCALGAPRLFGQVSGTCQGTPQPAWQSGFPGIPGSALRYLPDVALFAGDGVWNHSYLLCFSDIGNSLFPGAPCGKDPGGWAAGGGTSFTAPIMAGIQALVNQQTESRWGNPNTVYYKLARQYFAAHGAASNPCAANKGRNVGSNCVFHNITDGNTATVCTGSVNCYRLKGTYGILSSSAATFDPAFTARYGYNLATGLGSMNVANLLANWPEDD